MKRLFDFTFSCCLFVLILPFFVFIMFIIGVPFFQTQTRIGRHQRPFNIIKFRTMTSKYDENGDILSEEQRFTKVGKFLYKYNLDKLPVLINVMKGDLSLVGPMPFIAKNLPYLTKQEEQRFSIRPGITGLTQISGGENLSWDKRLALDVQYVIYRSFWIDIKILYKSLIRSFPKKRDNEHQMKMMRGLDEERSAFTVDPSPHINLTSLKISDSSRAISLIEAGLPTPIYKCTIYSCNGYKSYLEALLSISLLSPEQTMVHFIGAYKDDVLVGFAEWRIGENNLHLNNLYIQPNMRGLGVGKKLIQSGLRLAQKYHLSTLTVDVFVYNQSAISWFKRLGFIDRNTTFWYVGTNPVHTTQTDIPYQILNHHDAKNSHKLYDFSTLEISTPLNTYNIGRLNKTYFKIHDQSALEDPILLQALSIIDPIRSLLVLSSSPLDTTFPSLKEMDKSLRMILHLSNKKNQLF